MMSQLTTLLYFEAFDGDSTKKKMLSVLIISFGPPEIDSKLKIYEKIFNCLRTSYFQQAKKYSLQM